MPIDPLDRSTQPFANSSNNARASRAERHENRPESPDRIGLTKELEAFRETSDKKKFSLKGHKLGNEPEFVLGQIADVGRGTLQTLNLSNCGLEEPIDISQLRGTKLKALILRDNQTKEITGFEEVPELKIIDFSNTKASKAPQVGEHIVDIAQYADARNLEELSLANSGITAVTGLSEFEKHPHLKKIDLRGNPLSDIPDGLFSLPWRAILFDTSAFSSIAKMEYEIGVRLNPGHNVQVNDETSSMRSTHQTLNAAEKYGKEMSRDIEAIAQKSPEMANQLQARLYPHIQTQMISDQLESIDTLFKRWENPERQGSIDQQRAATARYRRNAKTTARALFYGSLALRPVEGRSDVSNATGWNAVSKIAHGAAVIGSAGTAAIPHIGGFISAPIKVGDALLTAYSTYTFNRINRAVSQVLEQDEVEPFCDAFSRGAAFMTARALPDKRSWLKRTFIDEPSYRTKQFSGTAGGVSKEEKMEEDLASGQTSKAILDLAFGKAMGVPEAEAAHQLRGMTTDQKVDKALRYFCSEQGIPYKRHLFVYRPSLNEQSTLAMKGLTRVALDTVNDSLESKEYFEKELADRDDALQRQGRELAELKATVRQQGYAIKTERQSRWQLKAVVRKLNPELSYSSGEEDGLEDALLEKMDTQMQKLLDSKLREQDVQREFVRIQNSVGRSSDDIQKAAKQGNAAAQHIFGAMNYKGIGVPKNLKAAAEWVSKAARQEYGGPTALTLRILIAKALRSDGIALGKHGLWKEACETYEVIETHFGEAKEPALRETFAKTLLNQGYAFGQRGLWREAIGAYKAVVRHFSRAAESDPTLRKVVDEALYGQEYALAQSGQRIGSSTA